MASIDNIKKSKKGRPPTDTEPVTVRMPRGDLQRLDAWRRTQDDLPTRPEAIRRLVEKGLGGPAGSSRQVGDLKLPAPAKRKTGPDSASVSKVDQLRRLREENGR